jgi:flagellar motor switch protein FliG
MMNKPNAGPIMKEACSILGDDNVATVCIALGENFADAVLRCLNEKDRRLIVEKVSALKYVPADVAKAAVERFYEVFASKILSFVGSDSGYDYASVRIIAELCDSLGDIASRIIDEVEVHDPLLASSVRDLRITFNDLSVVDDTGICRIMDAVDRKLIAMALRNAAPEVRERCLSNMAGIAGMEAELLKKEINTQGEIAAKDISRAQQEITSVMRDLFAKNLISFMADN